MLNINKILILQNEKNEFDVCRTSMIIFEFIAKYHHVIMKNIFENTTSIILRHMSNIISLTSIKQKFNLTFVELE
jgi:hypothetical protein